MIRYYHKNRFLGYGVGVNPLSGSIVLVNDDNEYRAFHREQITHCVVGETVLDERTTGVPRVEQGDSKTDRMSRPFLS